MSQRAIQTGSRILPWSLALGGVLTVVAWKLIIIAVAALREPGQIAALSSLREFKQEPAPNQANNRLVFAQDTAEGIGVFFCETGTGQSKLLGEQKERGSRGQRFGMLGWSPGDKWFACAIPNDQREEQWVHIFDGQSGAAASRVGVERGLTQFIWLDNDAFAYATATGIRTVLRQADGSWAHRRNYPDVGKNLEDLTALSATILAWRDEQRVGILDISSGGPRKIWSATTNQLVQLTRGRNAEELLLNCRDAAAQSLFRLQLDGTISRVEERLYDSGDFVRNVRWQGSGPTYAFLTNDPAGCAFVVKHPESSGRSLIPWRGGALRLTLNGGRLFYYGYQDSEGPGIWECDLKTGNFKLDFAAGDKMAKAGLVRPSSTALLTNRLGQVRSYHVWTPRQAAPGQKYPLLLAQELSAWFAGLQIASQCGYVVAVADRPFDHTWNGDLPHTWAEDVGALYTLMAKQPNVDTNRVYLYACSRDTSGLAELVTEQPALAKGLICFSPTALPDPARLQGRTLLLTTGAEAGDSQRLREFQDRASQNGNAVTLLLQPNSGHMPASGATETRRAQQLARYLQTQD